MSTGSLYATRQQQLREERRRAAQPLGADLWADDEYCDRVCAYCGDETWRKISAPSVLCFRCDNVSNPMNKGFGLSIDTAGEDSTHPDRVADGTARFNMGLRGIDTQVGTRADGKPKLDYRPVSHNELASRRSIKEYAKRTGCTPLESAPKRAIGGK